MPGTPRDPAQIQREIGAEREAMEAALEDLGNDVDDLVTELRQNVLDLAHKALVVAPIVGAVAGTLITATVLRRRRKGKSTGD